MSYDNLTQSNVKDNKNCNMERGSDIKSVFDMYMHGKYESFTSRGKQIMWTFWNPNTDFEI